MRGIAQVALRGFKKLNVVHDIKGCVALRGPSGVGKSAVLQAARFALDGSVPDGRKDDTVASYFPPGGGTVLLTDAQGRWLKRGVDIKRGRNRQVTRVLESSDTEKDAKLVDLSAWRCNPMLVDFGAFTGLSPEKRRQYVVALCGSEAESESPLIDVVGTYYAREIGGSAAKHTMLYDKDDWGGYTEDEQAILAAWAQGAASISECLQAVIVPDLSLAERCSKMMDEAGRSVTTYRAQAVQARQAIDELREQAENVRPLVEQLPALRKKVDLARQAHKSIAEEYARGCEAREALKDAKRRWSEAKDNMDAARAEAAKSNHPGDEPEEPPEVEVDLEEQERLVALVARLDKELGEHQQRVDAIDDAEEKLDQARESLENHRQAEHGKLTNLATVLHGRYPDDSDAENLYGLVASMTQGWKTGLKNRKARVEACRLGVEAAIKARDEADFDYESVYKERAEAIEKRDTVQAQIAAVQATYADSMRQYRKLRKAYDAKLKTFHEIEQARETADQVHAEAGAALEEARTRALEYEEATDETVDNSQAWVEREEANLETAVEAQGALKAYDDAVEQAHKAEIMEEAWKIAKTAVSYAREAVVADAVAPIREDMDAVYEAAGFDERVFMRLENERGTPIFEMGILRGNDRIPIGPMSDGETTLFLTALTIAIAMRSEGRRVLLLEADHLDTKQLYQAMTAVAPWQERFDLVLMATSRGLPQVEGWDVRELEMSAVT